MRPSGIPIVVVGAVLSLGLAGTAPAEQIAWHGYQWETQPISGYTGANVTIGVDGHLWTYSYSVPPTNVKNTSFLPYGGTYAERLGAAKFLWPTDKVGQKIASLTVDVYSGVTTGTTGWSVVIKNASGKILDFGVRPFQAAGKINAQMYDGSTWAGNNYLADRLRTGNDYGDITFTPLADGKVQVDYGYNYGGSTGSVSWTTPAAFGDIEDVYLVSATSTSTSHYYKWTSFNPVFVPEPGSLVALASGLIVLAGLALRRRNAR